MHVPSTFYPAAEKKLSKFDRFFPEDTEVVLKLSSKRSLDNVELTINYGGILYRSEKQADSLLTALDECIEATLRQIRKNKTKLEKKLRQGAFLKTAEEADILLVSAMLGNLNQDLACLKHCHATAAGYCTAVDGANGSKITCVQTAHTRILYKHRA